ncbi:hypothetical protein AB1Y20_015510 [Prymnesium parvum]|uniref:Inosine/uridine-preferring nucleoside hydrolase domain-containing protein n=1 Tax=Prymnesium parvum TaxID=97485 RepID=A0AB34JXE3_PRYPA|mmetsp:Transcript_18835/g.45150  ORF Transcript_18835/g.45150 Transcript_18835/m.45150 type:complete len:1224 (+) Transcript_18835:30-3701(+)
MGAACSAPPDGLEENSGHMERGASFARRASTRRFGSMKYTVPPQLPPYVSDKKVSHGLVDIDATESRIRKLSSLSTMPRKSPMYTLLHAGENFGSEWLDAMRAAGSDSAEVGSKLEMIMIGDFGKDLDDEKALAMAIALRRTGLLHSISVIANLGNTSIRARLAKGTANALGAHDVRVAVGTHAKAEKLAMNEYEIECAYLAPESELDPLGGHEMAFDAIQKCKAAGRKMTIVLCSMLTDMAELLLDPRWEEMAPGVVSHVVAMGGATPSSDGAMRADPEAANNAFDLPSARLVYDILRDDKRFWFIIVSRHAAAVCQLPRSAFDGSSHPVALRLTKAAAPALQKLWERVHMTETERLLAHDSLPMSRNPEWFRHSFLEPSAPPLAKNQPVWPHVRGFSEYDGLTTVVAATVIHPELFTMFFQPYCCPDSHTLIIGNSAKESGIVNGGKVSELLHFLVATSMGPGSGEWFGRLCDHQRPGAQHDGVATDMLMVGDFGKDQDDEKALVMAVAMRRTGLIGDLTVVANLGDSLNRARLAKGTLNALGAHDVPVAKGSDGGRPGEEIHSYEFDACPYLAPEHELDPRGGHELAFAALRDSREGGHKITIVLCSALTDMAALIRDPRWEELAPSTVSHIVAMGGTLEAADGHMRMDPESANSSFDLESAEFVYNHLREDTRFELIVVTRYAARECQLPKKAFDGSTHPIALRLTAVARPSLQKLWERVHRSQEERKALKDGLPMSRDPTWFRDTFLEADAPAHLTGEHEVWEYVKGFNEYDGLATIVAATATFPDLYNHFFKPYLYPDGHTWVIGRSPSELGITDNAKASELLHDLLVTAFYASGRFRKGYFVEVRSSPLFENWQLAILDEPARGQGPDCWMALIHHDADTCNGTIYRIPVYLTRSTEGVLWRLAHHLGDREPLLPNLRLGMRYRMVNGARADPYHITQSAWRRLRKNLTPRSGDIWVTGYPGTGNILVQFMVRVLLHDGDAEAAAAAKNASGITNPLEYDLAVGKLDIPYLDELPQSSRVFTTHQTPSNLPCMDVEFNKGSMRGLPPGVKCIHPIRDPRSACLAKWDPANCPWDVFAQAFVEGSEMPWRGYLEQNKAWWTAHGQFPEQILWITFEECKLTPHDAVRKVASFLSLHPSDEVVNKTVAAINYDKMKRCLERHPKLAHGGKLGDFSTWDPEHLSLFERGIFQPAREHGLVIATAGSPSTGPALAQAQKV